MTQKTIKTKKEYQQTLARFEQLFLSKAGTKESNEADALATLIKEYEDRNFIIGKKNVELHTLKK